MEDAILCGTSAEAGMDYCTADHLSSDGSICICQYVSSLTPSILLTEVNVALQGTADQSSLYHEVGSHAIDGNHDSIYSEKSCTHNNSDSPSWWRVDLKDSYEISTVIITNRADCCHERLQGAEIRIGD
ncbi:UNVERIFIED_CONTAM: hypothetical protein FKN15_039669 [Acipenser sinensis]